MRHKFRELESECHFCRPGEKATLTMMNNGQSNLDWEFECRNAIIDESRGSIDSGYVGKGYSAMCKFSGEDCPIYTELLRQAEEMTDAEYETVSKSV